MNKNNADLDLIRERLNILDIISNYIKLEKSGNQFKARCPFHNERTPSFYISPGRGNYHCFGCNEHGDIFGFIMKIEGVPFKEALKMLAEKAGVQLNYKNKEEKSSSLEILEYATQYWQANLEINKSAKEYLLRRGLTEETIKKWRIGFASNEWREIYHKLQNQSWTEEEILKSGLCIETEKEGRKTIYDRFRSRIMFPIMNSSGKVVAFTGRIIGLDEKKDGVAKYVNSPETEIYHKSSILFGYDKARSEIAKLKKILVVEGQMDCIMAHQAGNTNTVAISGTAFTEEHIKVIKRFADKVILALDTDNAGFNAMLKSAMLAIQNDLEVMGIEIKEKDPADMILHDLQAWKNTVFNEQSIFIILIKILQNKYDNKIILIQNVKKYIIPLLSHVKSNLLLDVYVSEIANLLNVEIVTIKNEIKNWQIQNNGVDSQINFKREENIEKKLQDKIKKNNDLNLEIAKSYAFIEFSKSISLLTILDQTIKDNLEILDININNDYKEIEYLKIEKEYFNLDPEKLTKAVKENVKNTCKKIINSARDKLQEQIKNEDNKEYKLKQISILSKKILEINML